MSAALRVARTYSIPFEKVAEYPAALVHTMHNEANNPKNDPNWRVLLLLAMQLNLFMQVHSKKNTTVPRWFELIPGWESLEEKEQRELEEMADQGSMILLPGDDDFHM